MALPDSAVNPDLSRSCGKDLLGVNLKICILSEDARKGSAALVSDFEPLVPEAQQETIRSALNRSSTQDTWKAAPNRERLAGIKQVVDQLPCD